MRTFLGFLLMTGILLPVSCKKHDSSKDEEPSPEEEGIAVTGIGEADGAHEGHETEGEDHSESGAVVSDQQKFELRVNWVKNPVAGSFDNVASVHFSAIGGRHAASSELRKFTLFMVTMGHGSDRGEEMVFTQEDSAHWKVEKVFFTMPGEAGAWVVDIEAVVDGVLDTARVPVILVE